MEILLSEAVVVHVGHLTEAHLVHEKQYHTAGPRESGKGALI